MKYIVTIFKKDLPYNIVFPEENMRFINLFFHHINTSQKYNEAINAVDEVQSGRIENRILTTNSCKVTINKDITEIKYTLDHDPEDWDPEGDTSDFSHIPTDKFKAAVEIWWKEYTYHKDKK